MGILKNNANKPETIAMVNAAILTFLSKHILFIINNIINMDKLKKCMEDYFKKCGDTHKSRLNLGNTAREMVLRSRKKSYKSGKSKGETRQFWFLLIIKLVLIILVLSSIVLKILEGYDVFKLDEDKQKVLETTQEWLEWSFILLMSFYLLYLFWPDNVINKINGKKPSWWKRKEGIGIPNQTQRFTVFLCAILIIILIITTIFENN